MLLFAVPGNNRFSKKEEILSDGFSILEVTGVADVYIFHHIKLFVFLP